MNTDAAVEAALHDAALPDAAKLPPLVTRYDQAWPAAQSDLNGTEDSQASTDLNAASTQGYDLIAGNNTFGDDLFGHWLAIPDQWSANVDQPASHCDNTSPSRKASDVNVQDQIDELRRTVSILVNDQQRYQSRFESQPEAQLVSTSHITETSLPTLKQPDAIGSLPSSGYVTPFGPFDFSDDSPICSRRVSTASITSMSTRGQRGQRIPGGYVCGVCDSRFDVPNQLKHHERKHIPKDERQHACEVCSNRFLYPKDVTRHLRQKHGITRPDQGIDSSGPSSAPHRPEDGSRTPLQQRRERRSAYIRNLKTSTRQKTNLTNESHGGSAISDDRRDSAIADVVANYMCDPKQESQTTSKQQELSRQLSDTIQRQQQTIQRFEQELRTATENAQKWQTERDAFAEFFQHMATSFDFHSTDHQPMSQIDSSSLTGRATGWLGAIEALLSTSSHQSLEEASRTHSCLQHIFSALENFEGPDDCG